MKLPANLTARAASLLERLGRCGYVEIRFETETTPRGLLLGFTAKRGGRPYELLLEVRQDDNLGAALAYLESAVETEERRHGGA